MTIQLVSCWNTISGDWHSKYFLSDVGKACKNPVRNSGDCENAANDYDEATFVVAHGAGYDLPYGCVTEYTKDKHYIFWNPQGATISGDPYVRQVCVAN